MNIDSGILNFTEVRNRIIKELEKPLPGSEYQYMMAPAFRLKHKSSGQSRKAAVLLLLYPNQGGLYTVFIKRPSYKGIHGGQISLPGGKTEENDKNAAETALRESKEEIGIETENVELLGKLTELYIPVSNILVVPVVGATPGKPSFITDNTEVEFLIEVPVRQFFHPDTVKDMVRFIRFRRALIPCYDINGHHIWGATAMIISEFIELLKRIDFQDL